MNTSQIGNFTDCCVMDVELGEGKTIEELRTLEEFGMDIED
jgi:hypothetical protein